MLAPEFFKKIGRSWFRMHYQFIMANDMRAPYEYMMLVCGPVPVEQWARRGQRHARALRRRRDAIALAKLGARDHAQQPQHEPPRQQPREQRRDLLLVPGITTRRPRISPS